MARPVLIAVALVMAAAVTSRATAAPPCEAAGAYQPICGVNAPEDLEQVPGTQRLLYSQASLAQTGQGAVFSELDLLTRSARRLPTASGLESGWGDPGCRVPDTRLGLHGINLSRRGDGRWQLMAVNHGTREATEFYELTLPGGVTTLTWRGCVVTPAKLMFNDIAADPDGGFVATMFMDAEAFKSPDSLERMFSGVPTGNVMQWSPGKGFRRLARTENSTPNGIQASSDQRYLYYASYGGRKLIKYDRRTERPGAETPVDFLPDNLTWTADGKLIAAGVSDKEGFLDCIKRRLDFCQVGFRVVELDPASMRVRTISEGPAGIVGGASVALRIDSALYIGAFAGDRLVRVSLP